MPALESPPRKWTEEEFYRARDAAPRGERWEFVDGDVLVTPSPHWHHQSIVGRLFLLIAPYISEQKIGTAFFAPLDVKLRKGLVTQPDLLVVPSGELRDEEYFVRKLLLAVESLSPSSARFDRVIKRPHYQQSAVPEYWIVDGESRTIERWQPHDDRPQILSESLSWHPDGASKPFVLDLPSLFRDALTPTTSSPESGQAR